MRVFIVQTRSTTGPQITDKHSRIVADHIVDAARVANALPLEADEIIHAIVDFGAATVLTSRQRIDAAAN